MRPLSVVAMLHSDISLLCPSCHVRTGQTTQELEGCWKGKFRCRFWKNGKTSAILQNK